MNRNLTAEEIGRRDAERKEAQRGPRRPQPAQKRGPGRPRSRGSHARSLRPPKLPDAKRFFVTKD